jgi:hypothetical protein
MQYQLSLIKNPSGTYSFVGSVPFPLSYERKDGGIVTPDYVTEQMRLPAKYRNIKAKTWASADDALAEAYQWGFNEVPVFG